MPAPEATISVDTANNKPAILKIFSESDNEDSLKVVSEAEASEFGEAAVQLLEGCSYEYKLTENYEIQNPSQLQGVVKPSRINRSSGRISPGIFVGTLSLDIIESHTGAKAGTAALEVRSVKASYREDYRFMLEDIAARCTDLLMQHSSPVTQSFTADFDKSSETIYQRFAFVKSIIDSDEFREAVHRIISAPVTAWAHTDEDADIRRIRRLNGSQMRQLVSRSSRINLPEGHSLKDRLDSIPARITVSRKTETVDTPENRFVKFALETFYRFCSEVRHKLGTGNGVNPRAWIEASILEERLESILNHGIFKEISRPASLPLNSPVLQRKEGYREVLRVWLMFDLAAKLIWNGGEDVYSAGKRDVAVLYEYWLFFKLLEIFSEVFSIGPEATEKLIEPSADGLGLKLKSGSYLPLKGEYTASGRRLKVQFSYNKTFPGSKPYPGQGSWSRQMRPDYTLSIWPADFSQIEAEEQESIVHIHFDAKYKVEGLKDIMGDENEDLYEEKQAQRKGTYKRADLLKMHAYKDAIRRTGGAYVLYPGNDKTAPMKGFHEIIPGLGAFAVRPSQTDDGTAALKSFIHEVVRHLLNRASRRDRMSYKTYEINKDKDDFEVRESLPEIYGKERAAPPADTFVAVGYCKSDAQYKWIETKGLYNYRIGSSRGSIRLSPEAAGADYILLHRESELITGNVWKITEKGPRVFSKEDMLKRGYPEPSNEYYLVYKVEKVDVNVFNGARWDVREIEGYKPGRSSGLPFAVSLAVLMKAKKQG